MMKIINSFIGLIIIVFGSLFMSITVDNDDIKTISYKAFGFFILSVGVLYLRKIANLGQR